MPEYQVFTQNVAQGRNVKNLEINQFIDSKQAWVQNTTNILIQSSQHLNKENYCQATGTETRDGTGNLGR